MAKIFGVQPIAQRVYGNQVNQQFTVPVTSGLYFGPSVTITPKVTGRYKVSVCCSLYSNSGNTFAAINNPSGATPVYIDNPIFLVQTAAFTCASVQAEVLLTEGLTYTFQTAVNSGAGGFILFESNTGPGEAMLVEQIL